MFKRWLFILVALVGLVALWGPRVSEAQLGRRGDFKPEDAYNPKPDQNSDMVFPMPCDLQMVFKAVALPVNKRLEDMKTNLGAESEENNPNGFYDRKRIAYLGSTLYLEDLTPEQRAIAEISLKNPNTGDYYGDQIYLIGKYEVTVGQWAAVMEDKCKTMTSESALPKTNISWYEALTFTEKYMSYLIKNHQEVLPAFSKKYTGLIRLPTEAEWEYAARGGHAVSSQDLESEAVFPLNGVSLSSYGHFLDSSGAKTNPTKIGSFRANPLGIYDTVGNVAEMTSDLFKMTVAGRLHGAATGGVVIKGGSFSKPENEILPGRRVEGALFTKGGPGKSEDLGFRLALSAVAVPDDIRLRELATELAAFGSTFQIEAGINPLDKLKALIEKADTPEEKAIFESLRTDMQNYNVAVMREKEASIRAHCNSLIHAVYSIRNSNMRKRLTESQLRILYDELEEAATDARQLPANQRAAMNKKIDNIRSTEGNKIKNEISNFDITIRNQFNYYKNLVNKVVEFDPKILVEQLKFVKNDIKNNDVYSDDMRKCFNFTVVHINEVLNGKTNRVKLEDLLK